MDWRIGAGRMDGVVDALNVVLFLGALGLVPGFIAHSKGRSFQAWWLFGSVLFVPAVIMALVLRKGDTAPIWGRWGFVSSPRRTLSLAPTFLAIDLVSVTAKTDGVKIVAIIVGCGLLSLVVNHFTKSRQEAI
jgi:hypothetical protein